MSKHHSPLEQFNVVKLFDLNLFGIDLGFTNSAFFMCASGICALIYLVFSLRKTEIVPSKLQITGELFCGLIIDMVEKNIGSQGKQFVPFVFALFMFVLLCNCLGLMPYGFTVTSHISITFCLAICVFGLVTIFGFVKHGRKFFSLFLPHGTPSWLAPLMVIIELFTFLARPISLSLRLTANMVAGHVLLKVIAGFILSLGLIWKFIPVPFIVILIGFEFFVAVLQAYIFAILTCVYLSDAVNLH